MRVFRNFRDVCDDYALPPVTDLLELASTLVAVRSESLDEARLADLVEANLRAQPHLDVHRHRENVVARTVLDRPMRLIIAGHLDTVPANDNLEARIVGDRLYGLGACDMKGGLAAMFQTAMDVVEPAVDVTYVFYSAEEIAAKHSGLLQLFEERAELMGGDAALLGEPTSAMIEAGCQGTMRARVTFLGERAHTARPWMGRNAIHRLREVLASLDQYEGRRPVIDGCEYREAIQAVFVEGGVAGNVVPDSATVTINHRFAPDRTAEEAEAHLREVVGECDDFEVTDMSIAAMPSLTHPLLRTLADRSGLEVRAKLGWTDVARFAAYGIPAANFGSGDPTLAHTRDEFVDRHEIETVHAALCDLLRHSPDLG